MIKNMPNLKIVIQIVLLSFSMSMVGCIGNDIQVQQAPKTLTTMSKKDTAQKMAILVATARPVGILAKKELTTMSSKHKKEIACLIKHAHDKQYAQSILPSVRLFLEGNTDKENAEFIKLLDDGLAQGLRNMTLISTETAIKYHQGLISMAERRKLIQNDSRLTVQQRATLKKLTNPKYKKLHNFLMFLSQNISLQNGYTRGAKQGMEEAKNFMSYLHNKCSLIK